MDKVLQRSLVDALSYSCSRELPQEDRGEEIWIYAIALVSKRDGSKSYAISKRGSDGESVICKDFGTVSQIVKVDAVYPYLYLDASYIPNFNGKKKDEMAKWLSLMNPAGDYAEMSLKDMKREVINIAIFNQLRDINNTKFTDNE